MTVNIKAASLLFILIATVACAPNHENLKKPGDGAVSVEHEGNPPKEDIRDRPRIRICTWNIDRLGGSNTRDEDAVKDMASIIHRNDCDLISIQEVQALAPVNRIRSLLNQKSSSASAWGRLVSKATGTGPGVQTESYALLWKTNTLEFVRSGGLVQRSRMWRSPHYAMFKSIQSGANFDFVIMSTHTKTAPHVRVDLVNLRRDFNRVRQITQEPDVILVGDLNQQPSVRANANWAPLADLSWVFNKPPFSSMANGSGKLNDNIVFGNPTREDFVSGAYIDEFEKEQRFRNSPPKHKRISDHRLGYADFRSDNDNSG